MLSFAQFATDNAAARFFPQGHLGTYLDVGAHHPVVGSNTYLFYERGWRGLTVEPTLRNVELHRQHRPEDICLPMAAGDGDLTEADFFECDETSVSTLIPDEATKRMHAGQGVTKRTVSVASVEFIADSLCGLFMHNDDEPMRRRICENIFRGPDLLSIDVEGHEAAVLRGCPWGRGWRPKVVILEACHPCTQEPSHHLWEHLLPQGYEHAVTCGVNRIYVFRPDAE